MRSNRLRTRVKICGIVSPEDARVAVEHGADALGFVFYEPSARYVAPDRVAEIVRDLPPFVDAVGVVVDLDPAELDNIARVSGIDCFQFHGDEDPQVCRATGLPFMKALKMRPDSDVRADAERYAGARGILLDAFVPELVGGTGSTFDWSRVPGSLPAPVILAGGLNVDNVASAIRVVRPYGVDVSSGVERSPGVKDPGRIVEFLQSVLEADAQLEPVRE